MADDDAGAVNNPVFDVESSGSVAAAATRQRLRDRLRGLKDGNATAEDTLDAMDEYFESKALLADPSKSSFSAVESIFAKISESPSNWHQAVIFFLSSTSPEDAEMHSKAPYLFVLSCLMITFQTATACAIAMGAWEPTCETSDQCERGLYCMTDKGRCQFCGEDVPMGIECAEGKGWSACQRSVKILNHTRASEICAGVVEDPTMSVFNLVDPYGEGESEARDDVSEGIHATLEWCDSCLHAVSGEVDPLDINTQMHLARNGMGIIDWMAFVCAGMVIGLAVAAEVKDVTLTAIALIRTQSEISSGWRVAAEILNAARLYMFLPSLVLCVPFLVLFKGGDSLSLCFNSLAVLFLCDLDNIAFKIAMGERAKRRVDQV